MFRTPGYLRGRFLAPFHPFGPPMAHAARMHGLLRAVALVLVVVLATGCAGSDLGKLVDAVTSARTPVARVSPRAAGAGGGTELRAVLQRRDLGEAEQC